MRRVDKEGMLFSSIFHMGVLFVMLLVSFFASAFKKQEQPHVFEMVELPQGEIMDAPIEEAPEVPTVQVKLPDWEPLPEPKVEKPKPKPVEVKPKPIEKKPEPKPVEKKPEPEPERKMISQAEFDKIYGKRPDPKPVKQTPPPTPPKVDTSKIEQQIRKTVMSVPSLSLSQSSPVSETSAERIWKSQLAAALKRLWEQVRSELPGGTSVRISFTVSSGGSLGNIKVLRSSGNRGFDQLGVNTLRRLGAFSPPPDRKPQSLTIEFTLD